MQDYASLAYRLHLVKYIQTQKQSLFVPLDVYVALPLFMAKMICREILKSAGKSLKQGAR
ncbi:hypothetical protein JO41_11430 [Treponema sp. OMZ 838]|nr:hypothetical protein JO41_11430 [Treponema sp. OMZ 838]